MTSPPGRDAAGVDPSGELIQGRRELDDVPGYRRLTDLVWRPLEQMWSLRFSLCVPVPPDAVADESVPEVTAWFALVAPEYPYGRIEIYPAAEAGITETYPHQKPNLPPREGQPWRGGELCVTTPYASLQREGYDTEPRAPEVRLKWHVSRTRSWIEKARRGALLDSGEPFELPFYAVPGSSPRVIFERRAADLDGWAGADDTFGVATIVTPTMNPYLRVVMRFTGPATRGGPEPSGLPLPAWGTALGAPWKVKQQEPAVWVRLPYVPALPPWRAPATWAELVACLAGHGIDLMAVLERTARALRDGKSHLLLLGAPLPTLVGEPPSCMHWIAVQLPALSHGEKVRKGHRRSETGYWLRDRTEVFRAGRPLTWVTSENWSPDEIATRGRAALDLRRARVVIIGVGALGSAVAELLVREGVTLITLIDDDDMGAGNLVRHALTLGDIGASKAQGLADHLNAANPHARVQAIGKGFPGGGVGEAALRAADIVVDCTANDAVVGQLAGFDWRGTKLFASCAVGLYAKRLFVFTIRAEQFPAGEFAASINPWLLAERGEYSETELPWEGTGCWHPVFPARASDFALFGAAVLRRLEALAGRPGDGPSLYVLEQHVAEDGVIDLRVAQSPPGRRCA